MARQRRPRAAAKRPSAPVERTEPSDAAPELPPELVAANERACVALEHRLEAPNNLKVVREHEEAKRAVKRLGKQWRTEITEAFQRAHGGRTVAAVEEFTPSPSNSPLPRGTRLRGETPSSRVRRSQRATPRRDERELTACAIAIDPEVEHARIVDAQRTRLEAIRASWTHITEVRAAIERLRSSVPAIVVVSEAARAEVMAHVEALRAHVDRAARPWYASAEDLWLPFASEDLNDDEIARILSPAGYTRDRTKALAAVRERRRKLEARAKTAAAPFPSELERRRRRSDPGGRDARTRKYANAIRLGAP